MKMKPIKKCGWCSRLRIRKAGICAVLSGGALLLGVDRVAAQADKANYDESKVPHYRLPEPLVCNDGRRVTSVGEWESRRAREILPLFRSQMYGYVPAPEVPLSMPIRYLCATAAPSYFFFLRFLDSWLILWKSSRFSFPAKRRWMLERCSQMT